MSARDVAFTLMALGHVAGCRGKSDTEILAEAVGEIVRLQTERDRYRFAVEEVSTHLGATKAIIKYAIETKPSRCLLTEKYDGICPHCEGDISWLEHELKAHREYSAVIEKALAQETK